MTQPAASELGVGAVLQETYELTSLLGKGGMGAVFLARHRRLPGRQVAIKVLHHGVSQNPELYARFRREAEIASQLGHPNIVEVLDFDTLADGTPFLVMEQLRGESLEQRLARGRLPLAQALAITRQMGSALQAAHRAGVVHRDLKPANVFLVPTDSEGGGGERVKLLDFGISKMLDSQTLQTQDSVLIGTPQYMAPEQALGKNSEVDARTDLFALGCILYEMLSGAPPFAGEGGSIVQVVFRIVHTQPEPLANLCPDLPWHVVSAVERALAKSPADRYPDIGSFITELTGSPLQSFPGVAPAARAAPVSDDVGFAATFAPSSTARFPASADEVGFAATVMPSSTARLPAPATDEVGFAATLMPASTARVPAPAVQSRPPPPVPTVPPEARVAAPEPVRAVTPELRRSRAKPLAALGLVGMTLGVLVAMGLFKSRPESAAPVPVVAPPPPVASAAPALPPAELKAPPPEAMPSVVVAAPPPTPPVAESRSPERESPERGSPERGSLERRTARQAARESVPDAVRSDLEAAARALDAGDTQEAIRLASRSQRTQSTEVAVSLLARAYCQKGDLSNARAQWRRLAPVERRRVRQYCRQYMEL